MIFFCRRKRFGHCYSLNSNVQYEIAGTSAKDKGLGNILRRIKKLISFIQDQNIAATEISNIKDIRRLTLMEKVSVKSDNIKNAEAVFTKLMKKLNSLDKKGETTKNVTVDSIDKRLIQIANNAATLPSSDIINEESEDEDNFENPL